jgi:hypothetical protein
MKLFYFLIYVFHLNIFYYEMLGFVSFATATISFAWNLYICEVIKVAAEVLLLLSMFY